MTKYLGFDLEVCTWPEENDWDRNTPLGISCIGLMGTGWDEPVVYYSGYSGNNPLPRPMHHDEISACFTHMRELTYEDYKIVSWNGLQFDFLVMALDDPGNDVAYAKFAMDHIDPMFEIFCRKGWPVGLNAVAKGMRLPGKTEGVSGADAPAMWMEGTLEDRQKVLEYVGQDAKTTLDIVEVGTRIEKLNWQSKSGKWQSIPYKTPLTTSGCLKLPQVDTSWMTDPMTRMSFYDWTES